jgi:Skp family chaperone for outer membrane proteins
MKGVVCLLTLIGTLLPLPARAQAPQPQQPGPGGVRFACFSPQRAFAESADGRAAAARLSALQAQKRREIEDRQKALQAQEQGLQKGLSMLNDEARSRRTKEIEKFRLDTLRFVEDAQAEFLGVQREIEGAFALKLSPALEQVARRQGIQLVVNLDAGAIAWFDPSVDITAEVVRNIASK